MDHGQRRQKIAGLLLGVALLLPIAACDRLSSMGRQEGGKAFIDSKIPSDLPPRYFPPSGFVFSGFKTRGLPEARYGVAAPPINPKAQVLILVEAEYPAEAYFGIMRDLLDGGYSVWLLEMPGQGGAGHFKRQAEAIDIESPKISQSVIEDFVTKVINPDAQKPLIILGSGVSATQALNLSRTSLGPKIKAIYAYDPYLGSGLKRGALWKRDQTTSGHLGGVAQAWQVYNPDLRLRAKTDRWIQAQDQTYKALSQPSVRQIIPLSKDPVKLWVLSPEVTTSDRQKALNRLCKQLRNCEARSVENMGELGAEIVATTKL